MNDEEYKLVRRFVDFICVLLVAFGACLFFQIPNSIEAIKVATPKEIFSIIFAFVYLIFSFIVYVFADKIFLKKETVK